MPRRPTSEMIAEHDQRERRRQRDFRVAADFVAEALAAFANVERIALFGSVAKPLEREANGRWSGKLHVSKDVDLAVWLTQTTGIGELGRARNVTVNQLVATAGVGVAHHQVDVFLLAADDDRYLGRLCSYSTCPKDKPPCRVPGCGSVPFLRQHEDFKFYANALSDAVILFDRRSGTNLKAADLPLRDTDTAPGRQPR